MPAESADRGAGLDQLGRRAAHRRLLRQLADRLGREAGLVRRCGRRWRSRRRAPCRAARAGEHVEVAADRHVGDAEQLDQVADPDAAAPRTSSRMRCLPLRGEHGHVPPARPRRHRPSRRSAPSTVAAGQQVGARGGDRDLAVEVVEQEQPGRAVGRARRTTSTPGGSLDDRLARRPPCAAVRARRPARRRSSRVPTYQAVPEPLVARVIAGAPAAGRRRSARRPRRSSRLHALGPHRRRRAVVERAPSRPPASGQNSSTRTPSRSRNAPG